MRYYSYETYLPGDPGARASVEDWFESLAEAQRCMEVSLSGLPEGSTGVCYRRYADGDVGYTRRHFLKDASGIMLDILDRHTTKEGRTDANS